MFKKAKNVWITIIIVLIAITLFQTYQSNTNVSGNTVEKIEKNRNNVIKQFLEKYDSNEFFKS